MLSHVNEKNQGAMVEVSEKAVSLREAHARSLVKLPESIFQLLTDNEIQSKKGPVFQTAIIAGTQAVKQTSNLIPFCHPLMIEGCTLNIYPNERQEIVIDCKVKVHHKTGVEMEALTGASIAALTIYDMCKAMSHDIRIVQTELMAKKGGKCDFERAE